ncbi:hypothetical protein ACFQE0_19290 [Methylobacterium komagatae]|uniref:Uncharacterized protein n=1 Tax=Methylobacterium komagatae TaxID=374425 RepID=A0ABW2BPR5_9HYPH
MADDADAGDHFDGRDRMAGEEAVLRHARGELADQRVVEQPVGGLRHHAEIPLQAAQVGQVVFGAEGGRLRQGPEPPAPGRIGPLLAPVAQPEHPGRHLDIGILDEDAGEHHVRHHEVLVAGHDQRPGQEQGRHHLAAENAGQHLVGQPVQAEVAMPEKREERRLKPGLGLDAGVDQQKPLLQQPLVRQAAIDADVGVGIVEFEVAHLRDAGHLGLGQLEGALAGGVPAELLEILIEDGGGNIGDAPPAGRDHHPADGERIVGHDPTLDHGAGVEIDVEPHAPGLVPNPINPFGMAERDVDGRVCEAGLTGAVGSLQYG